MIDLMYSCLKINFAPEICIKTHFKAKKSCGRPYVKEHNFKDYLRDI